MSVDNRGTGLFCICSLVYASRKIKRWEIRFRQKSVHLNNTSTDNTQKALRFYCVWRCLLVDGKFKQEPRIDCEIDSCKAPPLSVSVSDCCQHRCCDTAWKYESEMMKISLERRIKSTKATFVKNWNEGDPWIWTVVVCFAFTFVFRGHVRPNWMKAKLVLSDKSAIRSLVNICIFSVPSQMKTSATKRNVNVSLLTKYTGSFACVSTNNLTNKSSSDSD